MGWIVFIIVLIIFWNIVLYISDKTFSIGNFFIGVLLTAFTWFALLFISLIITSACSRVIQTVEYETLSMGSTYITDNHCCINKDEKLKIIEIDEVNLSLDSHKPVIKEHLLTAPKWITAIYPSALFEYTEYELIIPITAD